MMRTIFLIVGGIGCLLMSLAGLLKSLEGEVPLGLLLVGFSLSLFANMRCMSVHSKKRNLSH